jgi:hypothetical protein
VELGIRKLLDIVAMRCRIALEQLRRTLILVLKHNLEAKSQTLTLKSSLALTVCSQCGHKGLSLVALCPKQHGFLSKIKAVPAGKPSDLPDVSDISAIGTAPFSSSQSSETPKLPTDVSTDWRVSRANLTDVQRRRKAVRVNFSCMQSRALGTGGREEGLERLVRLVLGRVQRAFDMTLLSRRKCN